ncbi:hypothetical protein ABT297_29560 [Dactylosporangium sp. NPDC000555]|uniref:hypothetical protein n=1 Tax=Dactylosporangium sp. NPDC000555 TaxID=3154260 RepID=UPI0033254633
MTNKLPGRTGDRPPRRPTAQSTERHGNSQSPARRQSNRGRPKAGNGTVPERADHTIHDLPEDGSFERTPDVAGTRNVLAVVISVTFGLTVLMIVVGVLINRINPDVLLAVLPAMAAAFAASAYFYFRR